MCGLEVAKTFISSLAARRGREQNCVLCHVIQSVQEVALASPGINGNAADLHDIQKNKIKYKDSVHVNKINSSELGKLCDFESVLI